MKVDNEPYGTVAVVTPHGPLAGEDTSDFRRSAQEALAAKDGRVVLDLHDVPYLDSAGIEALVELCTDSVALARPRLAQLDETCRETLSITRVLEQLDVFDTVESAVRSFKQ